nr:hypothetical protein CFP56_10234 [Quercus suber]
MLFCDLIIAKLMKKSENNARDERERKRKSNLMDDVFSQSTAFAMASLKPVDVYTEPAGVQGAPVLRQQSSSADVEEADESDLLDEDADISDGSEDSVVPFRAQNWNAVNTSAADSIASRTRPLKKKSSKAMSTSGSKRPAETHTPKRASKTPRAELAPPSRSQLIVRLKLDPFKLVSLPHRPSGSPTSTRHVVGREDGFAVEQHFKRPSLPPRLPVLDQQPDAQMHMARDDQFKKSAYHPSAENNVSTHPQPSSPSDGISVASRNPRGPSGTPALDEVSAQRSIGVTQASEHADRESRFAASARSHGQFEKTEAVPTTPTNPHANQKANGILARTKCYFDMIDAIGRPGVVCFPLSRLVDADSLFSVVESYVPEAFQRENKARAITISAFRPSTSVDTCELPFEPCFVKADPWSRYTFDAFFLALEQRLNAAAGAMSPPHLLLSAMWERNSKG